MAHSLSIDVDWTVPSSSDMAYIQECSAAIRGEKLPNDLSLEATRLCIIRGIRYHPGFATELYSLGDQYPELIRALNARSIMSNIIPNMKKAHEFPYCIWHPNVASESIYRELARRYPQMRYQAGRACAVAGYTSLFHELDLLPEVSIAEEARDNQESGKAIFDSIMASMVKYAVLDDYKLSAELDYPKAGACLNGDTAVRSSLDVKTPFERDGTFGQSLWLWRWNLYFDITEDGHVDNYEKEDRPAPDPHVVQYLYTPLPVDLPNINKDVLILQAAYSGNVDRYARLRRPRMLRGEFQCVMRGIFHNTMFAKWWSLQPEVTHHQHLRQAINARFIMNNDLSRITDDTPYSDLPYNIYYPARPAWKTLEELVRRKPSMAPQVARVCIAADMQGVYDGIKAVPDQFLVREARGSLKRHYLTDLLRRAAELGIDVEEKLSHGETWKIHLWKWATEETRDWLTDYISWFNRDYTTEMVGDQPGEGIYEGFDCNFGRVNLNVCIHDLTQEKMLGAGGTDISRDSVE
ncbi:hypothetical protein VE04_09110 [Pseudogymnoascus sp. 24MN13]|nr:hypothetical protein VE04_09110 [Pseudogymnoascus sp. 24MN13]